MRGRGTESGTLAAMMNARIVADAWAWHGERHVGSDRRAGTLRLMADVYPIRQMSDRGYQGQTGQDGRDAQSRRINAVPVRTVPVSLGVVIRQPGRGSR
jgi:hypothetical protein